MEGERDITAHSTDGTEQQGEGDGRSLAREGRSVKYNKRLEGV